MALRGSGSSVGQYASWSRETTIKSMARTLASPGCHTLKPATIGPMPTSTSTSRSIAPIRSSQQPYSSTVSPPGRGSCSRSVSDTQDDYWTPILVWQPPESGAIPKTSITEGPGPDTITITKTSLTRERSTTSHTMTSTVLTTTTSTVPPPSAIASNSSRKIPMAMIGGVVGGVAVIVLGLIFIICLLRRRRRRRPFLGLSDDVRSIHSRTSLCEERRSDTPQRDSGLTEDLAPSYRTNDSLPMYLEEDDPFQSKYEIVTVPRPRP